MALRAAQDRRRRHNLTRQAKIAPDIPDLLARDFTAEQPDEKWVTDISYVPTAEGWMYLAVLLDLCSKTVVGWAADTHMRTELILDALTMALTARRPGPGLIVHSDGGSHPVHVPGVAGCARRGRREGVDGPGRGVLG